MPENTSPPAKKKVQTTMFQDPIEVDEDEIPGLRSQGLLVEDSTGESGTAVKPAGKRATS